MANVLDRFFVGLTNIAVKILDVIVTVLFGTLPARIITGLLLFNALGYFLMYRDKSYALYNGEVKKANPNLDEKQLKPLLKRRIPERTLILTAMVFGSLGILAGMKKFNHKTQKPLFKYGVPIIIAVQVFLVIYSIIRRLIAPGV